MSLYIILDNNEKQILSNLKHNERFVTKRAIFQNIQNLIIAVWVKNTLIGEFRTEDINVNTPIYLEDSVT